MRSMSEHVGYFRNSVLDTYGKRDIDNVFNGEKGAAVGVNLAKGRSSNWIYIALFVDCNGNPAYSRHSSKQEEIKCAQGVDDVLYACEDLTEFVAEVEEE